MKFIILTIQIILSVAFLAAGVFKLISPIAQLTENMAWVEDFSAWQIRVIALIEIIGAGGLILPLVYKNLPKKIVIFSAFGLTAIMIGAIITHISRDESVMVPFWLGILALFIGLIKQKWIE